jgi:dihydroorotate dehydrogenase (fumarate)
MDLSTRYLGLKLNNPLVAAASPLSRRADNVRQLEDAGMAAVVLYSLFEEEAESQVLPFEQPARRGGGNFQQALDYFPEHAEFNVSPAAYLEHIRHLKEAVDIPIIASLNGTTPGGWIELARQIEAAGADAVELNLYFLPADAELSGQMVEDRYLDTLAVVRDTVNIPVAVKLGPYFSSMSHMARQLDGGGANALVLFNRFYQPDIDLAHLDVYPHLLLSTPQDMRLPLRWIAILYGQLKADLAATGGIHTAEEVVKMIMAGASVTMLASVLLQRGIDYTRELLLNLEDWFEDNECESVKGLRGSMSLRHCANPAAFERGNYIKALSTFQ